MEDELAARRGGIDVFLQTAEPDVAALKLSDGVHEMAQRATQPIELPNDQRVARPQMVENLGQLRSFVEGAAGRVHKQAVAVSRAKSIELQVGVLVGGRYARVAQQVRHGAAAYQKRQTEVVLRR